MVGIKVVAIGNIAVGVGTARVGFGRLFPRNKREKAVNKLRRLAEEDSFHPAAGKVSDGFITVGWTRVS